MSSWPSSPRSRYASTSSPAAAGRSATAAPPGPFTLACRRSAACVRQPASTRQSSVASLMTPSEPRPRDSFSSRARYCFTSAAATGGSVARASALRACTAAFVLQSALQRRSNRSVSVLTTPFECSPSRPRSRYSTTSCGAVPGSAATASSPSIHTSASVRQPTATSTPSVATLIVSIASLPNDSRSGAATNSTTCEAPVGSADTATASRLSAATSSTLRHPAPTSASRFASTAMPLRNAAASTTSRSAASHFSRCSALSATSSTSPPSAVSTANPSV